MNVLCVNHLKFRVIVGLFVFHLSGATEVMRLCFIISKSQRNFEGCRGFTLQSYGFAYFLAVLLDRMNPKEWIQMSG